MKKFSIIALILVLTVSLCACGRNNNAPTTVDPTVATPAPTILPNKPEMDPTLDTNIPDPEVDSNSTMPGGMTTDPGNGNQSGNDSQSGNGGQSGNGSQSGNGGQSGNDSQSGNGTASGSTGEQTGTNDNSRSRMRNIK